MNSSLAITNDATDRSPAPASPQHAFRVVSGVEARSDSSSDVSDAKVEKHAAADAPSVTTPVVAPVKHSSAPMSDVEHLASQLDVEKVLLVPAGVTITGDIETNGLASLVISGTVKGNVKAGAGAVIVRESGTVHGSIHSEESVVVAGEVSNPDGPAIVTSGLWILAETAKVRGDVAYARHRAYEGGVFSGRAIPFIEYKA